MSWRSILLIVLLIIIVIAAVVLIVVPAPQTAVAPTQEATSTPPQQGASLDDAITVTSPLPSAQVSSPLTVSGKARGNWYFEASAPVELRDANGAVLAQSHLQAQGDWMTSDYVPFSASLTFSPQPAGTQGTLVLKNDNPSGDPAKEKELDIPVTF